VKYELDFHIPEDGILHSNRRGNLKPFITLTGWALQRRRNVSPVKYELGFYIPEDDIPHSHRCENLKSYIALTGWALQRRRNVSPVKYELGFYIPEDDIPHSHRRDLSSYMFSCLYLAITWSYHKEVKGTECYMFPGDVPV
jgi:hypothetical protein